MYRINLDGSLIKGKLGKKLEEEDGRHAARQCRLAILLSPEYDKHPIVINGCSEL